MLDFEVVTFDFPNLTGREQTQTRSAVMSGSVRTANAALQTFDIGYDGDDHNVLREKIDVVILEIQNNVVTLRVDYLLRDSSGNIDDPYNGTVRVLVIADVADGPIIP
jgi:hypothetical protein